MGYFPAGGAPPAAPAAASFALPPLCPLNTRVGLNSPSLCPTMSSVTYTFTNAFQLCTRNVAPMNSGTTVQSRDHVLIGSLFMPCRSTLARRRRSTCGPFFSDRPIERPRQESRRHTPCADNLDCPTIPRPAVTSAGRNLAPRVGTRSVPTTLLRVGALRPAADDRLRAGLPLVPRLPALRQH